MAARFDVKDFIGRHKVLATFAAVALLIFVLIAWPSIYWSHDINLRIVDQNTGQPVAGAVAVANWAIEGCFPESCDVSELTVKEGASNASGQLLIAGWGPKLLFFHGEVNPHAPKIVVFKPDYEVAVLYNKPGGQWHARTASDWNGKAISLKPLNGVVETRATQIAMVSDELEYMRRFAEGCYWERTPLMLKAIRDEERRVEEVAPSLRSKIDSIVDVLLASDRSITRRISSSCTPPGRFVGSLK